MVREEIIRLSFFFGVLTVVAVWEVIAPRRTLTDCKGRRWFTNLSLVVLDTAGRLAIDELLMNELANIKSAEKRIEGRVEEAKATEAKISTATGQKAEQDAARFKSIITMYEGMKPKDAAKVFDRLEMSVLIEIASQIAPRKMSDILGLMTPEAAERLTVELARRAGADRPETSAELPKIEGKIVPVKSN